MTTLQKLKELSAKDGYLYTSDVVHSGIRKEHLKKYVDEGILIHETRGVYSFSDGMSDEFVLLQKRCKKGIFSHDTALYFHGLSDRAPLIMTMTIPQNYNVYYLQDTMPQVHFKRVKPEWWALGIEEMTSPQGGTIRVYNKERCICDIVRDRKNMDIQIFSDAIKQYFGSKHFNAVRLMEYAQQFRIEKKIQDITEVLL